MEGGLRRAAIENRGSVAEGGGSWRTRSGGSGAEGVGRRGSVEEGLSRNGSRSASSNGSTPLSAARVPSLEEAQEVSHPGSERERGREREREREPGGRKERQRERARGSKRLRMRPKDVLPQHTPNSACSRLTS